jgi:ADP-ribose pyrophosphatase
MSTIWETRVSRHLARYRIFDLREDICISPRTGEEFPFYVLETRDWVNILPITGDGRIVLVRQYRFGTGEVTLELPGGLVDKEDTSPLVAAHREMREETGYDSNDITALGSVRPNPAVQNNTCHLFVARDVELKCAQRLDSAEDIAVELYTMDEVKRMIATGVINHCLVLNTFYFYEILNQK